MRTTQSGWRPAAPPLKNDKPAGAINLKFSREKLIFQKLCYMEFPRSNSRKHSMGEKSVEELSSLRRAIRVLKALAEQKDGAMRLNDVAQAVGCNQPTAHRALRELAAEGFVEQVAGGKRYKLVFCFFVFSVFV